ncbi:hypothetical protein PIB30_068578 [Stylosanthes scabra]|uniref:Uncharacterized protein n=1 Tax=Stylosanthes scabra TaxID=79078 RepID=A0ABU6YNQ3_9FABA|nr:hypothetical protein [Stylosanthes scabra]
MEVTTVPGDTGGGYGRRRRGSSVVTAAAIGGTHGKTNHHHRVLLRVQKRQRQDDRDDDEVNGAVDGAEAQRNGDDVAAFNNDDGELDGGSNGASGGTHNFTSQSQVTFSSFTTSHLPRRCHRNNYHVTTTTATRSLSLMSHSSHMPLSHLVSLFTSTVSPPFLFFAAGTDHLRYCCAALSLVANVRFSEPWSVGRAPNSLYHLRQTPFASVPPSSPPPCCHSLFTTIRAPSAAAPSSLFFEKQSPLQPPSVVGAPSVGTPSVS